MGRTRGRLGGRGHRRHRRPGDRERASRTTIGADVGRQRQLAYVDDRERRNMLHVGPSRRGAHLANFGLGLPVARRAVLGQVEREVNDLLRLCQLLPRRSRAVTRRRPPPRRSGPARASVWRRRSRRRSRRAGVSLARLRAGGGAVRGTPRPPLGGALARLVNSTATRSPVVAIITLPSLGAGIRRTGPAGNQRRLVTRIRSS